jgi:hypothetical protein
VPSTPIANDVDGNTGGFAPKDAGSHAGDSEGSLNRIRPEERFIIVAGYAITYFNQYTENKFGQRTYRGYNIQESTN